MIDGMESHSEFPRVVNCEGCGETSVVRAYVPIFDVTDQVEHQKSGTAPKAVQLTIDCPKCGIGMQTLKLSHNPEPPS